jgi:hypothetical protein
LDVARVFLAILHETAGTVQKCGSRHIENRAAPPRARTHLLVSAPHRGRQVQKDAQGRCALLLGREAMVGNELAFGYGTLPIP